MKTLHTQLIVVLIFFLGLSACGGPQMPDLPPGEIVTLSAERMSGLEGFEFTIERSGESAFLDIDETISFRRASGKFQYPDKVVASVRVIAPGLVTEVEIISIEGTQWETNLLTNEWQVSDPKYSFNPAVLFDPDTGLQAVLQSDLEGIELLGFEELEEVPGLPLISISAIMRGAQAYYLTYGMIDPELLAVNLWIDPRTYDLHRVVIIDPMDDGEVEDTVWQIDFWNFGEVFEITPPY